MINKTNYDLLQKWMDGDVSLSSTQLTDLLENKDVVNESVNNIDIKLEEWIKEHLNYKENEIDKFNKFINWLEILWKINPTIFEKIDIDMLYSRMNLVYRLEEKISNKTIDEKNELEQSEEMIDKAIQEFFDANPEYVDEDYNDEEDDEIADEEYEHWTESNESPFVNMNYCFSCNKYNDNTKLWNVNHTSLDDVYRMMQQDQDETDAEDKRKQDEYINGRINYIKTLHKNQAEQEKKQLVWNKLNEISNLSKQIIRDLDL